jgi:hypothetical protein
LAKEKHIAILLDVDEALRKHPVRYIFEATGDEKLLQLLNPKCPNGTQVINYQISLFFFDLLDKMRENLNREIVNELIGVKKTLTGNSRIIQESLKEVD